MDEPPLATVAICTRDRAADVATCFESLTPQARAHGLPVLVVDNESEPGQAARLEALCAEHGALYRRFEGGGISPTRSFAHMQARGGWVVFLDDDAIPHADWADRLVPALRTAPDDVAMIGGRIKARWPEGARTDHISARWMLMLSCLDHDGQHPADGGQHNVAAANLAIRRSALEAAGRFPTTLGRIGSTHLLTGEESYLVEKFSEMGLRTVYDGDIVVDHSIHPERLEARWARQRAYWEGATRVQISRTLGQKLPASMNVVKLAASIPVLWAMKAVSSDIDYDLRRQRALGSLRWRLFGPSASRGGG